MRVTLPTSYKVDTSVNTHEYTLQLIARVARIECIHVTSSCAKTHYELITSVFTRHEWWRRHHLPERSQTRNEYFLARVVPRVRHTRVFVKFKSSCTVAIATYMIISDDTMMYAYNYYTYVIMVTFVSLLCHHHHKLNLKHIQVDTHFSAQGKLLPREHM